MTLTISSEKMNSNTDMSLDDIISKKKAINRGRGRGNRARGRGFVQRGARGAGRGLRGAGGRGAAGRGGAFVPRGGRGFTRGRGLGRGVFRGGRGLGFSRGGARGGTVQTSSKLNITNLDFGVSDADIKELFAEFGQMKNTAVHYDASGKALGTAHVIFAKRGDAVNALKQYNGVHLDGRPMKILLDNSSGPVAQSFTGRGGFVRGRGTRRPVKRLVGGPRPITGGVQRGRGRGRGGMRGTRGFRGGLRGRGARGGNTTRGRGGRGRGRGRGGQGKPVTESELDAQLDAYNNEVTS